MGCATADQAEAFIRRTRDIARHETLLCTEPDDPWGFNTLLSYLVAPQAHPPWFNHWIYDTTRDNQCDELTYRLYPQRCDDDPEQAHAYRLTCTTRRDGSGIEVALRYTWNDEINRYEIDASRIEFHNL
jgi:hypothetical protein